MKSAPRNDKINENFASVSRYITLSQGQPSCYLAMDFPHLDNFISALNLPWQAIRSSSFLATRNAFPPPNMPIICQISLFTPYFGG